MTRYGCKRSPVDTRDYKYRIALVAVVPPVLPPKIDFTDKMTPIRNQGNEGSCVGFASVAMKEFQERPKHKCCSQKNFSERYVYEKAKERDGDPFPHEGTTIRAAMEVLYKLGVCKESCWRYIPNVTMKPCALADIKSLPNRIASYVAIEDVLAMKQALVSNGPFVIGIDCFTSFDSGSGGHIPMPKPNENIDGAHAICIVAYDDDTKEFKFKNSWGKMWGDWGYGYLQYDYMARYAFDGWLATDLP